MQPRADLLIRKARVIDLPDGKKGMEDWDQAELEAAIAAKHGAEVRTFMPTLISFRDRQGETIRTAVARVQDYVKQNPIENAEYLLAGGLVGAVAQDHLQRGDEVDRVLAAQRQRRRHHAVEHEAAHRGRELPRELLRHARAVGAAGDVECRRADREPQGLWMPGSVRQLEEMMLEGRIRLQKSPVLISAMMSAVIETDRWDNYWLSKQRATNKIDAAVALCMAIGAAMASDTGATIDDWLKSLAA